MGKKSKYRIGIEKEIEDLTAEIIGERDAYVKESVSRETNIASLEKARERLMNLLENLEPVEKGVKDVI